MRAAPTAELRAHLAIGLAADAVGLGDRKAVDRALSRVPRVRHWRVRVRAEWVRCERELLAGRPAPAARHARRALQIASRAGARRHEAKSLLFLGAALRSGALSGSRGATGPARREAEGSLRRASLLARRIGARPVARVAESLLHEGTRR